MTQAAPPLYKSAMQPVSRSVQANGVRMHCLDWGGDGIPLLLVHPTGFLAALWSPVAEALSLRYRVLAPDLRGHGDTEKVSDGYAFETLAADVAALLDALSVRECVAAGHSSGGTTIAVHAARYPGVIRRMALLEPIILPRAWAASGQNPMVERTRRRRWHWPDREEMFRSFRGRGPFAMWRDDILRLYCEEGTRSNGHGRVELKCPPELEVKFYQAAGPPFDAWWYLPRVACPVLLLWGEQSDMVQGDHPASIERALPDARTAFVPGTDHFLPMEQPEEVARRLDEFLRE